MSCLPDLEDALLSWRQLCKDLTDKNLYKMAKSTSWSLSEYRVAVVLTKGMGFATKMETGGLAFMHLRYLYTMNAVNGTTNDLFVFSVSMVDPPDGFI